MSPPNPRPGRLPSRCLFPCPYLLRNRRIRISAQKAWQRGAVSANCFVENLLPLLGSRVVRELAPVCGPIDLGLVKQSDLIDSVTVSGPPKAWDGFPIRGPGCM